MKSAKLNLATRYYRTLPITRMGYETETVELDPRRTALVALHCWDIGCDGGPAIDPNYYVGMGTLDSYREAVRILQECVRPAIDAARRAGVLVCHVEHPAIAAQFPQSREAVDPPPPAAVPAEPPRPRAVPGHVERMVARTFGQDYDTKSPYARMGRAKIVEPLPAEPVVYQTGQFDRILRQRGIENLIYSGFAADMCILRAPGGAEPMFGFGYRQFLLRDATVGVEFPDSFPDRVATRWAVRYFESRLGNGLLTRDFITACGAVAPANRAK